MTTPEHILTKNFMGLSRGYFNRVIAPCLETIRTQSTPIVKTYVIAGKNVRVQCYGEMLAEKLSLALSHHDHTIQNPDLTIIACDSWAMHQDILPPWKESEYEQEQANLTDDGFLGVYIAGEESLNFYDPVTNTGYFGVHDAGRLPDWATGAPFRTILHWFLSEHDIHLFHGAVVGYDDKAVLLTAKGGSGKSTTALACLLGGMDYLADDYAAIDGIDGTTAYSLYHSAKVTEQGLGLFPELREKIWNKDFHDPEKGIVFLGDFFPNQIKIKSSLQAILIPRITGKETKIVAASKMQALLAIAPTTLLQLPWAETRKVGAFKSIIEKLPCYFLELGPEIRKNSDVVKEFLATEGL